MKFSRLEHGLEIQLAHEQAVDASLILLKRKSGKQSVLEERTIKGPWIAGTMVRKQKNNLFVGCALSPVTIIISCTE